MFRVYFLPITWMVYLAAQQHQHIEFTKDNTSYTNRGVCWQIIERYLEQTCAQYFNPGKSGLSFLIMRWEFQLAGGMQFSSNFGHNWPLL